MILAGVVSVLIHNDVGERRSEPKPSTGSPQSREGLQTGSRPDDIVTDGAMIWDITAARALAPSMKKGDRGRKRSDDIDASLTAGAARASLSDLTRNAGRIAQASAHRRGLFEIMKRITLDWSSKKWDACCQASRINSDGISHHTEGHRLWWAPKGSAQFPALGSNQSTPKHCNYRFARMCAIAPLAMFCYQSDACLESNKAPPEGRRVARCLAITHC